MAKGWIWRGWWSGGIAPAAGMPGMGGEKAGICPWLATEREGRVAVEATLNCRLSRVRLPLETGTEEGRVPRPAPRRRSAIRDSARRRTRLAAMLAGRNHSFIASMSSLTPTPVLRKLAEGNSWLMKRFQRVMPAAPT